MLFLFLLINNIESTSATSHTSIQEMTGTFNILETIYPNASSKTEYVLFTGIENQKLYKLDINQEVESMMHLVGNPVKIKGFQNNVNVNSPLFNKNILESNIMSIINPDEMISVSEINLVVETIPVSEQLEILTPSSISKQPEILTPSSTFVLDNTVTTTAKTPPAFIAASELLQPPHLLQRQAP